MCLSDVYRKRKASWCAPASVQNALYLLGHNVSQRRLARIMREDGGGANEVDIQNALDEIGASWSEYGFDNDRDAMAWLLNASTIWPLLLSVDDYEHWVCVVAGVNGRLLLIDPDNDPITRPVATKSVLRRWGASRSAAEQEGAPYYGIAVMRGPLGASR